MDIGKINTNIADTNRTPVKFTGGKAKDPKDVFTPSSAGEADQSFANLSGRKFTASDAGKFLLESKKNLDAAYNKSVLKPDWEVRGGIYYGSNLVYDKKNQRLYGGVEEVPKTSRHKHHLTCFNPDGSVRWKHEDEGFRSGASHDKDGNVYFCGMYSLVALDKDGNKKWSIGLKDQFYTDYPPVVSPDGTVFAISPDESNKLEMTRITAVKDGKVKWTYNTANDWGRKNNSIVTGKDGTLYIAARKNVKEQGMIFQKSHTEDYLIGLNPDGTEKFRTPVEGWAKESRGTLTVGSDSNIYTIQGGGKLCVYSPDGDEKLSVQLTGKRNGQDVTLSTNFPPAVDEDGNIYIAAENFRKGELICLDGKGKEKWRGSIDKKFSTKPHLSPDGKIAISGEDEHIHIYDKDGVPLKKYLVGGEERINRAYGRKMTGMCSNCYSNFAYDENGEILVGTSDWILAFDPDADPFLQITAGDNRETKDTTIQVKEKNVVIGGVKLKRNRVE